MSISITPKAAEKVMEIATAEELMGQGLRLRVIGGGSNVLVSDEIVPRVALPAPQVEA